MLIELRGVEFVNKGAELMLHAITEKLSDSIEHVEFVMEANSRVPVEKLKENHILRKANFIKKGVNLTSVFDAIPSRVLKRKGLAKQKKVDVILDASGFAYGDKWGAKKAGQRTADHIKSWKKEGKKVILLPQAFGPFSDEDLKQKMKVILEESDLVFARDSVSKSHLMGLGNYASIHEAPDFTNLVSGISPEKDFSKKIGIIPNQKMTETGEEDAEKMYLDYLRKTIELLQDKGEIPFFLIHESAHDAQIAEAINSVLKNPIEVLMQQNPLKVKGIIGNSKAVITSRFHGLVSALCQSVPCLSTGWSHKYQELLADYEYSNALCEVKNDSDYLNEKLAIILDAESRETVKNSLQKNAAIQKKKSVDMWGRVLDEIQS
ncbi:polysaccharide pyruvyl transferase family protein [Algoriphagus sediminis]|uniref:Polysaccharide pyruvyl transferase family protein n=1 Tax=Algoriphagus sediminis TaxID=3057113 RepID=A0ABT7YE08_9BACT|nr:polysaccharide pyruvyl transferase family protein [Algoriphagus sediminis]MDN3204760.1 polysaccharide pyruvyl transferase family protein [Algoriphagus sediminis]